MPATRTGRETIGWPAEKRFMRFVEITDDGCWRWTSVVDDNGRGRFKLEGRMVKAHIAALKIFKDQTLLSGFEAHHECLNSACANPDHVVILSQADHKAEHKRLREAKNGIEDSP